MEQPLVSVIIPCFNYGEFLPDALKSIESQNYPNVEIIVVDDGSTDDTKEICEKYPKVKYIYQTNQGLSAARNTGIEASNGEFLIFLDADDWLLPDAITSNLPFLLENEELAFVSGAYEVRYTVTGKIHNSFEDVKSDYYTRLLVGNYVGVPASVLYRRWIFDEVLFDTTLNGCQDYDLYFKITRKHPVFYHTKKIAAYRIHAANMSSNISAMLNEALFVLDRQKKNLKTISEKKAYQKGKEYWRHYYCWELYKNISSGVAHPSVKHLLFIARHQPLILHPLFNSFLDHYRIAGFDGIRFLLSKKREKNELVNLKVRWLKNVLYLRNKTSDVPMFYHVFQSKEYDFNFDFEPKVIVDCGARIGLESVFFANKFPDAVIYSVEPEKENFELLLKNTESYPNIKCLNYGVWNKSTNLKTVNTNSDIWELMTKEVEYKDEKTFAALSIEEIMNRCEIDHIDICKINIEGAEIELFAENSEKWLPKTRAIIIELHDRMRQGCAKSFFDAISKYNFTVFPSGSYLVCILK